MTEAQRCRALAAADRQMAAETNLELVRLRHLLSAGVWQTRAEMFERTGLKAIDDEAVA